LRVPPPDERPRRRRGLRYGYLRHGGTHRHLCRMGVRCGQRREERHYSLGLGWDDPHLSGASGGAELGPGPGLPQDRLDQGGRSEAGSVIILVFIDTYFPQRGTALRGRRQALFPKRAWTKRGKGGIPPFEVTPKS